MHAKVRLLGKATQHEFDSLLVETGAAFAILPQDFIEKVGVADVFAEAPTQLERGDGPSLRRDLRGCNYYRGSSMGYVGSDIRRSQVCACKFAFEDLELKDDPATGSWDWLVKRF